MLEIKIQRVHHDGVKFSTVPEIQTTGSAGYDLVAAISENVSISPGKTVIIPSGIRISFSNNNYFGLVAARSGLAFRHGITLPNGVGIIDPDYTGEIKVILTNFSKKKYIVKPADRIAQLLFVPVEKPIMSEVPYLDLDDENQTERDARGFGSTGR